MHRKMRRIAVATEERFKSEAVSQVEHLWSTMYGVRSIMECDLRLTVQALHVASIFGPLSKYGTVGEGASCEGHHSQERRDVPSAAAADVDSSPAHVCPDTRRAT